MASKQTYEKVFNFNSIRKMEIKTTIQYQCTLTQIDEWKRLKILCGLKGVDQMEILHTVNGAVKKNHFGK